MTRWIPVPIILDKMTKSIESKMYHLKRMTMPQGCHSTSCINQLTTILQQAKSSPGASITQERPHIKTRVTFPLHGNLLQKNYFRKINVQQLLEESYIFSQKIAITRVLKALQNLFGRYYRRSSFPLKDDTKLESILK